ncbi:hypothetical protein [Micromonospora marina]|uniref:hypothetical protein n=1 Tax=Micromonospora marina TaxID=307120 RepID=UPI00345172B0
MTYDRFVAMVLMDAGYELTRRGLIAQRGDGDSFDYRPPSVVSGRHRADPGLARLVAVVR